MAQHINENEFDGQINLSGLMQFCKDLIRGVKVISATIPKRQVVLMRELTRKDPWMANIGACDAIESGDILPLDASYVRVTDKRDVKTMVNVLTQIIANNTEKVYCKCLVNESTVENLKTLKNALVAEKIAVFYTTAETGKWSEIDGVKTQYNSITEFAEAVNNYAGDCIVLHIKQVIAGVDISGLTHCVIRNCENTQADTIRMIQTIGRTLRYANSKERTERQAEIRSLIKAKIDACI